MVRNRRSLVDNWWFWLIPLVLILAVFYLLPILDVIRLSFTDTRIDRTSYHYSFDSYRRVLTNKSFWGTLRITFIFAMGSVVFQLGIGLGCALLINRDLPGAGLVKLSMIIAWIVPGIITGVIWEMLYSKANWGVINNFLRSIGHNPVSFLATPGSALICCMIANIWRGTGSSGIMQYSAIKSIPKEYFESAKLDGANCFQVFFKITLPTIRPMIMINLVLISIYSINTYDSIYSLTQGGPGDGTTVLPLRAYKSVFTYLSLGQGSVYAIILMFLSIILTLIYFRMLGTKDEE